MCVTLVSLVQPWHTQSAALHRILAAVSLAKPERTWAFLGALYENSSMWSDAECENLGEKQIMEKAAKISESATGIDPEGLVNLCHSTEVNDVIKAHARYARQNSIHVTPSALYNGCKIADFNSTWTIEDWGQFLANP